VPDRSKSARSASSSASGRPSSARPETDHASGEGLPDGRPAVARASSAGRRAAATLAEPTAPEPRRRGRGGAASNGGSDGDGDGSGGNGSGGNGNGNGRATRRRGADRAAGADLSRLTASLRRLRDGDFAHRMGAADDPAFDEAFALFDEVAALRSGLTARSCA
jgi:hypothetical protein